VEDFASLHVEDVGCGTDVPASLKQSARLVRLWASLPSWSVELGKLSSAAIDPTNSVEAHGGSGSAAEYWSAVEGSFEKIRNMTEALPQQDDADSFAAGASLFDEVQTLQRVLSSFVKHFSDEARNRLRSAHASTGRLLEQKRRIVDDMNTQLEARDTALQKALDQCAALSSRLRAVEERCAIAENLAADTAAHLSRTQEALEQVEASAAAMASSSSQQVAATPDEMLSASIASLPDLKAGSQQSLNGLAELVSALRAELDDAEQQRVAAEIAKGESEKQVQSLQIRYEEDCQTFRAAATGTRANLMASSSLSKWPLLESGSTITKAVQPADLLEELQGVARDSAYQRAIAMEDVLRSELQEARGELEQRWDEERQKQAEEDAAAAADVAATQERLSQMHAGAFFEKVSFKRSLKQRRYVRLTFDCRRIEWGQNQRGPMSIMPVDAILRVDFGDTSRAFRCFEFGRQDRPKPGRCFSICTPSRTLDLIAPSDHEVEVWVLGLNEVIPYHMERQRFTAQEFLLRRTILRLEGPEGHSIEDADCGSNGTSNFTSVADGSESGRSNNVGARRAMPVRWGFQFAR
jgi:hypothetical protein